MLHVSCHHQHVSLLPLHLSSLLQHD
jgi:hypothetical protein